MESPTTRVPGGEARLQQLQHGRADVLPAVQVIRRSPGIRSRCLAPQRRRDRARLERAVAAGRLPAGLDPETETDLLTGPLYSRVPVSAGPVGEEFTDALADAFLLRHDGPASAR